MSVEGESSLVEGILERLQVRAPGRVPETQVIYLHREDTVASVTDRLDWQVAGRIVLVIPPDSYVLSTRLDLLRVQRHAHQNKVGLAIVTGNPDQRSILRELGIPTFYSADRAANSYWRTKPPALSPDKSLNAKAERPDPHEFRPSDSKLSGYILLGITAGVVLVLVYDLLTLASLDPRQLAKDAVYGTVGGAAAGLLALLSATILKRYFPRASRMLRWALMALVFAVGIFAPLVAAYIIVPGARLTLTPTERKLSAIARITVVVPSSDQETGLEEIDFDGQRIAGRRVSAEAGGEALSAATGTTEVPSSRATGTVVFTNLLAQDYTVGKNTAVRTSAGTPVRFVTTGDVTVPPLGQAAVGIEAVEPGPSGNVASGLINRVEGAAARAVRVTNPEVTRGGGVSQVRAVTQEDRDALRRSVLAELRSQGYQRVLERPEAEGGLKEGEYLVPGSVRIFQVLHETYDRFATEEAESVKVEMRVEVTGVVVDLGDAYNLARHVLESRVPEGYELVSVEFRPGLMGDNVLGDGTLTFFVTADGMFRAKLDHNIVKQWLRGKTADDGLVLLRTAQESEELPVSEDPEIEIWPDWAVGRFPWLIWRIEVAEKGHGN
jgi:hypothetical protein